MSSSISSSRSTYAKILLAMVLGMGLAMAIIRLITFLNDVSGDTILGRVQQARAALPKIVAGEEDLVMFFGSSMVQAGFSARVFDRLLAERGAEVKSFNFGFGGLNPLFQDYLARRIREQFEQNDRRLELALLEFNPFQTTQKRYNGAVSAIDSFVTMLASPAEMWEIALRDPTRGVRMLNIHYLRDDISAEMITNEFGGAFRPPIPTSDLPEDEALEERIDALGDQLGEKFDEEYPDYDGAQWSWPWQGAGTIPSERSAETLELFDEWYAIRNHDRRMSNDRLWRDHCCDILGLNFEEELVAAYIRLVKEFQRFSNRVEVVLLPRNTDWIEYSPEAAARLAAVVERIEHETGLNLRDYQTLPEITPDMYSDTTHLARYLGDVPFTEFLVDEYAESLGGSPEAAPEVHSGGQDSTAETSTTQ